MRKKKPLEILILGILISFVLTNIFLTKGVCLERILAVGQVYELRESSLTASNSTWIYDADTKRYTINSDKATKGYGAWNEEVDWKCLYIELANLNRETVDWVVKVYDENKENVGQQIVSLKNGENWIELNIDNPFQQFSIQIVGGMGLQFQIQKMMLLEEIPQKKEGLLCFAIVLILYLIFAIIIQNTKNGTVRLREKAECMWDGLHFVYRVIGNSGENKIEEKWSAKKKNQVRTGCFCALFVYMLIINCQGVGTSNEQFRYHGLVYAVIILVIAVLAKEGQLIKCKWNTKVSYYWLMFWACVCISDFVVTKRLKFVGWIMFFVTGFFIYVWQHMKHPMDIIKNIMNAIEIVAFVGIVYNMIFRLKYDGILYNGYLSSTSEFAVYSSFLCLIFLAEIHMRWKKKCFDWKMILAFCGVGCSLLQVLLTGKKMAVVYSVILVVIAGIGGSIGFIHLTKKKKGKILICMGLAVSMTLLYYVSVKTLPLKLHTEIRYEAETYETNRTPEVISILAVNDDEIYQNVKFYDSNKQNIIRKTCLRETNLLGHHLPKVKVWGKSFAIQNVFLQILYRYGIVAFVIYMYMFLTASCNVIRKLKSTWGRWKSIDILTAGIFFLWWILGICNDLENSYCQPAWFLFYLLLGRYITERNVKKCRNIDSDLV